MFGTMETGTANFSFGSIDKLFPQKGYGFITSQDFQQQIFFHARQIQDARSFESLIVGQRVRFLTESSSKGLSAGIVWLEPSASGGEYSIDPSAGPYVLGPRQAAPMSAPPRAYIAGHYAPPAAQVQRWREPDERELNGGDDGVQAAGPATAMYFPYPFNYGPALVSVQSPQGTLQAAVAAQPRMVRAVPYGEDVSGGATSHSPTASNGSGPFAEKRIYYGWDDVTTAREERCARVGRLKATLVEAALPAYLLDTDVLQETPSIRTTLASARMFASEVLLLNIPEDIRRCLTTIKNNASWAHHAQHEVDRSGRRNPFKVTDEVVDQLVDALESVISWLTVNKATLKLRVNRGSISSLKDE